LEGLEKNALGRLLFPYASEGLKPKRGGMEQARVKARGGEAWRA